MGAIRIRPAEDIEQAAREAYDEHRARIAELLPDAQIEHVGATSVPGALTKGDVDLLVRVAAGELDAAAAALGALYAVHQEENWTPTFASFVDPDPPGLPVGIQLAASGSAEDALFGPFRDALIRDPALLEEYNALKLRLDGEQYDRYTEEKAAFIERVLLRRGPSASGEGPSVE
jgi:GrpB-like predicted nucleotidyltransferase (UPF0157 family)